MWTYFLQDCRTSWMFRLGGTVHFIYSFYLLRLLWKSRTICMVKTLLESSLRSVFAPAKYSLAKLLNEGIYIAVLSWLCDLCCALTWWLKWTCSLSQIKMHVGGKLRVGFAQRFLYKVSMNTMKGCCTTVSKTSAASTGGLHLLPRDSICASSCF